MKSAFDNKITKPLIIGCLGLLFALQVQAQEFRFAVLTDLHITTGTTAVEDLQRAVKQINLTDGLDFVLVTGDLTEGGDRASLMRAKQLLDELKIPYYAVAGNHETKWSASGVTAFSEIFGSERFEFEHDGILFLGFNTGPFMRMADGHVPPQDITWLKQRLEAAGKEQPVILVTHYPLQDGDVDNWRDLIEEVRPYHILTFIGGHYHSDRQLSYDGISGILCRSTLRAEEPVGGYSIVEVGKDNMVVSEQLIGGKPREWAVVPVYPYVEETWLLHTGVGIYSSPVVWRDKVFVGDDQGTLTCYALADGQKQWNFHSKARIVGTPAVSSDGIVVFGSADKHIYGLDATNGSLKWTVAAREPVLGAVSIENSTAYIGASDSTFRAIDVRTGKIRWAYTGIRGYIETKPLLTSDKVIFSAWDNTLYALDKTTGREVWKWTGGLTRMHYSPAAVWPVAAHGKVFITDPQRAMTAVDLSTGETVWRTFQSMVRETIGLSEDNERVYSKTMNDSIVCYATRGNEPRELWASNVGFGYEHAPSMPLEKDGVVFGSTKGGLLFGLDAMTGRVLWKHKVGNALINTVLPLSGRQVLFTASGGEVGLLTIKER
ncbi:MAG: PQQ-binding-like beta-propeller repeat protein [Prevotellaceae bacterium]|nr:PQQ-binding-like beta-propeller repeat protein [Prevotellaceae bacterium]